MRRKVQTRLWTFPDFLVMGFRGLHKREVKIRPLETHDSLLIMRT
jgi:hypothetical protein